MTPSTVISMIQGLTAATFVIIPAIAFRYGRQAQRAAEREIATQRLPGDLLTRSRINFSESAAASLLPLGIAAVLAVMAALNMTESQAGRALTWALQPLLLIAGGVTTAGQVFPAAYARAAMRRAGITEAVDTRAVIREAAAAFPAILRPLTVARFGLVTAGSVAVLVLLPA